MKNKIITSEGNVMFVFGDTGKIINVHPNFIYTSFNVDTVTFMLTSLAKSSGLCIMATKATDLEINGVTYPFNQLPNVISEAFSAAGAYIHYEIVQTLPSSGSPATVYLVPIQQSAATDHYEEYIWIREESRWELIGTTSIDVDGFVTKQVFSAYTASTEALIDENERVIAAALNDLNARIISLSGSTSGLSLVAYSGSYNDLSNKPDLTIYAETSAVTAEISEAVSGKANSSDVYTKAEVDSAISAATDDMATQTWVGQQGYITGVDLSDYAMTSAVTEAIDEATSGKLDTSVFETYSGDVETALGNKQDASGMTAYTQNTAFTAHTNDSSIHLTTGDVQSQIDSSISGKVETSAITSAVTSASTDNEIPTAKAVYDAIPTGGTGTAYSAGTGISIVDYVISNTAIVTVDQTIVSGSTNAVAGGAVYTALGDINTILSSI